MVIGLNRLKHFIVIAGCLISLYYIYKETKEYVSKYFDQQTLQYFKVYVIGSSFLFAILFKYYFLNY